MLKYKKLCPQCCELFLDYNYHKNRKFCSIKCRGLAKRKATTEERCCKLCNKKFIVIPSQKRQAKRIFCSNSCAKKYSPSNKSTDPYVIFLRNTIIPQDKNKCWLYTKLIHPIYGYGKIYVDSKKYPVHRFSYEWHNKTKITNGLLVCHKCDVRNCVNPGHLFLGTHQDNATDKMKKGRCKPRKGENHPDAKLTNHQVIQIRNKIKNSENVNYSEIAREFNVSNDIIRRIAHNKTWKSLITSPG